MRASRQGSGLLGFRAARLFVIAGPSFGSVLPFCVHAFCMTYPSLKLLGVCRLSQSQQVAPFGCLPNAAHPDAFRGGGGEHACGAVEQCEGIETRAESLARLANPIPAKTPP